MEQNVDYLQPAEAAQMVRVIEARHAVQEAVNNVVDITKSVLARSFPFDQGGLCCSHISLLPLSQPKLSTVTRRRTVRRRFVDVCSGQQSLAQYVLLCDPAMHSFMRVILISFWVHQSNSVHTRVGTVKHHPLSCSTAYAYGARSSTSSIMRIGTS